MTAQEYFDKHGISPATIAAFNLTVEHNTIVIPVYDSEGKLLYRKYRHLDFDRDNPDSIKFSYDKGSAATLYNSRVLTKGDYVFLCEGEPDTWRLSQEGLPAISNTSGSGTFKEEWVEQLKKKEVYVIYDTDKAGRAGADKIKNLLPKAVIVKLPPAYKDLCEFFLENDLNRLAAIVEVAKKENVVVEKPVENNTDLGNAEHFIGLFGDLVRYDHRRGRWLLWDGNIWEPDSDEKVRRMAIDSARDRARVAIEVKDLTERSRALKWAIGNESNKRVSDCLSLTRSLLPVASKGEQWDKIENVIACPNGIVDLTTGELRGGRPEDCITMKARVAFDPLAKAPRWNRFIGEIFENNQEVMDYVRLALGYSIGTSTKEQVLFFCFGTGSNGKSVLFRVIREVLGNYAHSVPEQTFQVQQGGATNDIAAAEHKRFIVSAETMAAKRINEARLKAWSGEDEISARFLYKEFVTFKPVGKIWLFLNEKPVVEDDSRGFWRRVRLIPFTKTFEGVEVDEGLIDALRLELPGILAWLVRAHHDWRKQGLKKVPPIIQEATNVFQAESDPLADFISERCEDNYAGEIKASTLYAAYRQWAEIQNLKGKEVLSSSAFGTKMAYKYKKHHDRTGWWYLGLKLAEK